MVTAVIPVAPPVPPGGNPTSAWHRLTGAARGRAGRVEWILLVLAMLVPQLVILLLGSD